MFFKRRFFSGRGGWKVWKQLYHSTVTVATSLDYFSFCLFFISLHCSWENEEINYIVMAEFQHACPNIEVKASVDSSIWRKRDKHFLSPFSDFTWFAFQFRSKYSMVPQPIIVLWITKEVVWLKAVEKLMDSFWPCQT